MPISAADKTLLETHPHKIKFYLIVHQPETVLAAQVNGDVSGDPVTTITFDNVAEGAFGNVEAGQTLLIGSTAGAHDRGIVRVRSATSTVLTIAESSDLRPVEDDDYLTVLREHRFWVKYPRLVSASEVYEDYDVAYVSENYQFSPIAMLGPSAVVFLDGASVDIDYDFSESYPIAGASISSYATTYQHGDGGSSATSTHTETYSSETGLSGSETKLVVTDNNAQTAAGWRVDFVLSRTGANAPITDFLVTNAIKGSWEGNDPLEFLLFGDAYQTTIRDGSHVILAYESWYASTQKEISLEYPDRANILFEGWVDGDTITRESDHSVVRFSALPITKMLEEGKAYPATLELASSPTTWYQVTSCSTVKAALYICKWRSTLAGIVDIHIPTAYTSTSGEDWSSGTIKQQLAQPLEADSMTAVQHKSGALYFEKLANVMNASERAALDLAIIIESKHWVAPLEVPEVATPEANYVLFEGVYFDGADGFPYFSEAPGLAAKYRGQDGGKIDRLAIDDQDEINQLSGDYLALRNSKYPKIPVRFAGFWPVVDCAPQRRYRVAMTSGMNIRGANISGLNFIPRAWQIELNQPQGFGRTAVDFAEETDGEDGQTVVYKTEPPPIVSIPRPGPYVPPYSPPPYTPTDEGRRIMATDAGPAVCDDISSPRWYLVNNGFSTANDKYVYDVKRDPFHWWSTGGDERRLWAFTRSGIWYMNDFPTGIWTQLISYSTLLATFGYGDNAPNYCYKGRIGLSIEEDGLFACVFGLPEDAGFGGWQHHNVVVISGGAIESSAELDAWANSAADSAMGWPSVVALPHSSAQSFLAASMRVPGNIGESRARLWKTATRGVAWAQIDIDLGWGDNGGHTSVSVPYVSATNPDQYILWGSGGFIAGTNGQYRLSENGGTSFDDLPNSDSSYSRLGTGGQPDHILLLADEPDLTACKWSDDKGQSYTTLALMGIEMDTFAALAKWDGGQLTNVLIGSEDDEKVYLWSSSGWEDKTANLGSLGVTSIHAIDRDTMGTA